MRKIFEIFGALLLVATIGGASVSAQSVSVTGFTLIDAVTNQPVAGYDPVPANAILNLNQLPAKLTLRANTLSAEVRSVRFGLDGNDKFRTENVAPYSLTGDSNGSYNSWNLAPGLHTVTAVAFAQGSDTPSATYSLNFTLSDAQDNATPTPTPSSDDPRPDPLPVGMISGELRKWHNVTLSFVGPHASETGSPNPFLDYRLNVRFSHPASGKSYLVPGYFAADGNAANSSATEGNIWRVHFAPDQIGTWHYSASFRSGAQVSVSTVTDAGSSGGYMDGASGSFVIEPTNKSGRDLRGKGRLQYVGEHYLRFAGTGEYFLKGGADSPENFLAYEDFDNTPDEEGRRKSWSAHEQDYQNDGPTWQNGKGSEILGAINYLAASGVNAFSFLTMNTQGDDRNVFPYVTRSGAATPAGGYVVARTQFDVSKLDQWGLVFEHATHKGMYLHFKLQETENDRLLDDGDLGIERKLYYRELIARFAHNLALNWNISEEFNPGSEAARLAEYAAYFNTVDPYQHPLVVHTYPGDREEIYGAVVDQKILTGVSMQVDWENVHGVTKQWRDRSALQASQGLGQKWVVANDEQGSASYGVPPDAGCSGAPSQAAIRQRTLWGNLMAGGGGVEYYFGYNCSCSDLSCQDYRSRASVWQYTQHALLFFQRYVPFWEMVNDNTLSSVENDYVFAKAGEVYVIYLPAGGTTTIDLQAGTYDLYWYDPRQGGELQTGTVTSVEGSASTAIGSPPSEPSSDWVVLIQKHGLPSGPPPPQITDTTDPTPSATDEDDISTPGHSVTPGATDPPPATTAELGTITPTPGSPDDGALSTATPVPGTPSSTSSPTPITDSPELPPTGIDSTFLFLPAISQ